MANLNEVRLIGRLTRDVETRTFANGGMVAKFGFAVEGSRRKDQSTGKWESEPCFLDVEAFNRGEKGTLATTCETYLRKGSQCFIAGKLVMQQWAGQDGQKRSKLVVEADRVEFLGSPQDKGGRQQDSGDGDDYQEQGRSAAAAAPVDLFGGDANPFA